jgi:hypothetical protein
MGLEEERVQMLNELKRNYKDKCSWCLWFAFELLLQAFAFMCIHPLSFYMCVVQITHPTNLTYDIFYCRKGVGNKAKDDWAWSTIETSNTKRRFTIVGPSSNNITISPYNNEHSPCNTTPSCPKPNVDGMLNPVVIHKLPKSPLKPIVVVHPIALDDDLGMDKIS